MSRKHAEPDLESLAATAATGVAPGKQARTQTIQRKAAGAEAPAAAAPTSTSPGAAPATGPTDDPYGMHLQNPAGAGADDFIGPPMAMPEHGEIDVRVNEGALERWAVVELRKDGSFVATDPAQHRYHFTAGATTHEEQARPEGGGRGRKVYDVRISPKPAAEQAKTAVGKLWALVIKGREWVEEQTTGKSRAELDEEARKRELHDVPGTRG